jgi:putative Holliday junction resolvase
MDSRRAANDSRDPGSAQPPGRIAAIDYGTVRIGTALSDPGRTIASPWQTYTRRTPALDAAEFRRLAAEEAVVLWVVGLPVHLDGRESRKSLEARQFGRWLEHATGLPVAYFDERFTTTEAEDLLRQAALRGKRRKRRVDMLAAQVLLTAYLESQNKGQGGPQPLDD